MSEERAVQGNVGDFYDLYSALKSIDDGEFKLAGEIRIRLAINSNLLTPVAVAYEKQRQKLVVEANAVAKEDKDDNGAHAQLVLLESMEAMRGEPVDVSLRSLKLSDLKLDENPKLGVNTLVQLRPIIEDFGA